MIPYPMHPAVVHFPIVLMLLLPPVAVISILAVRRGADPRMAVRAPLALALLLSVSAWLAVETGEEGEETVEDMIPSVALERHEEGAELMMAMAGVSTVLLGLGLARGKLGQAGMLAGTAVAVATVVVGWQVGHSGGELVYRHGAAQPYVTAVQAGSPPQIQVGDDDD